ncbi:MAG: RagB/SusD family nutrient uptake outer membrane protein [Chitinophagaceae bacterium]
MKNYGLKLLTNYADLWNITNQRNTEVLWAVNYSTNLAVNGGTSNQGHSMVLMEYNTLPGMTRDVANGLANVLYMPTRFLLNLFNETDDARSSGSFKLAWIANNTATIPKWTAAEAAQNAALTPVVGQAKFAVGDTAIFITKQNIYDFQRNYSNRYRYKTYDINDVYNSNGTPKDRFHYISLKKFDEPARASATETQSSYDAYLIRLAEMYLVAAEARFKLNKLDSAAYFVNEVRKRVALPGRQVAIQITPAMVTLDFLLDERAREFAGEQLRWFDLRRTGKLVERVKVDNPDAAAYIQDFHALRPIAHAQIDAVTNKSEFKQNPGY